MPTDVDQALKLFDQERLVVMAGLAWRWFDIVASAIWATTGALLAAKRGFDMIGMFAIALVSSTGGGLLRDGLFLQVGPPAVVRTPVYIAIAGAATLVIWYYAHHAHRLSAVDRVAAWADTIGLGGFAVVGMQLASALGLSLPGVVLIGVVNAVGGGVLRNLLMRQVPIIFRPGQWTALAALLGCLLYELLTAGLGMDRRLAAAPTVGLVALLRWISIRYKLYTRAPLHRHRRKTRLERLAEAQAAAAKPDPTQPAPPSGAADSARE